MGRVLDHSIKTGTEVIKRCQKTGLCPVPAFRGAFGVGLQLQRAADRGERAVSTPWLRAQDIGRDLSF